MKEQLEASEAAKDRQAGGGRALDIKWVDSKKESPVSVTIIGSLPARFAGVLGRTGGFFIYWVKRGGHAVGLRKESPPHWKNVSQVHSHLGIALLFALMIGFAGCVGYVGPGGPGPYYGPDFAVFGGGYYHGHFAHAYSVRGAASRGGFHGHR